MRDWLISVLLILMVLVALGVAGEDERRMAMETSSIHCWSVQQWERSWDR